MADFTANITSGAIRIVWADDATPSRINPLPDRAHTYWTTSIGQTITVTATVGGTVAPLNGALGGRLFYAKWSEWPAGWAPPNVVVTPGQSSVMTFTPLALGHYVFVMKRQVGGGIMIPFEVEDIV